MDYHLIWRTERSTTPNDFMLPKFGWPTVSLQHGPGLSLSFNSPVALIFTPIANLLLYGWIVSTTCNFTCNIKGPSNMLSHNRCYGLPPLLTALGYTGMYSPKRYCFLAVLVRNRASVLAILVSNRVWFSTLVLNSRWYGFLEEATFSSLLIRPSTKVPSQCLSHWSELGNQL